MPKESLERGDDVKLSYDEGQALGDGDDEDEDEDEFRLFTGHLRADP